MAKPKKYKITRQKQEEKPPPDPLYFLGIDLAAQAEKLKQRAQKYWDTYKDGGYANKKGVLAT